MEVIAHNFTVIIIPCVITNTRCDLGQDSDDRSCFDDDCDVRFVARHHQYGRFAMLHSFATKRKLARVATLLIPFTLMADADIGVRR